LDMEFFHKHRPKTLNIFQKLLEIGVSNLNEKTNCGGFIQFRRA
jgi:hypothetical protein